MSRADPRPRLRAAERASVLARLFRCARLADEAAMARVNSEAGRNVLRRAITNLLPHLSFDGIRVVELARKVGVSKQAVSKLLGELAGAGLVEMVPDPADQRAKLVRYTPRGFAAIQHGLSVLAALERELKQKVGARRMRALGEILDALLTALDQRSAQGAP
jgi:DNA-binding MarR family transcriptional regulator